MYTIIRLLLDSYLRQLTCVAWGLFKSRYFSLSNGVKQGGVLSPILFTLYIDKLLIRLKHAHIGCHMNNIFTGALSYADDNNNNCLKSNIQCIEIRVQWTVHLGSSHMHVHAVTPKLVICVMYLTSI